MDVCDGWCLVSGVAGRPSSYSLYHSSSSTEMKRRGKGTTRPAEGAGLRTLWQTDGGLGGRDETELLFPAQHEAHDRKLSGGEGSVE